MPDLTDKADNLRGEMSDLAAQVEQLKSDIDGVRHAANRIRPTGRPYTVQTPNPSRVMDQAGITLANLTRTVAALIDDLAQAGIIRKT